MNYLAQKFDHTFSRKARFGPTGIRVVVCPITQGDAYNRAFIFSFKAKNLIELIKVKSAQYGRVNANCRSRHSHAS